MSTGRGHALSHTHWSYNLDLGLEKLGFAIAILLAAWLGGGVPLVRREMASNPRFLSWGNSFAAGIFLSIGFVHMLSDAVAQFHEMGQGPGLVFFLAAVAFVFMLLLEHVLLPSDAHERLHAESGAAGPGLGDGHGWKHLYPYALIAALSVHSIFAGIALGVQESPREFIPDLRRDRGPQSDREFRTLGQLGPAERTPRPDRWPDRLLLLHDPTRDCPRRQHPGHHLRGRSARGQCRCCRIGRRNFYLYRLAGSDPRRIPAARKRVGQVVLDGRGTTLHEPTRTLDLGAGLKN